MQSHWDKLPTIRVVDAGYLLAGMEPESKWQFAPPLVKNLFNLIRDKTGAVTMSTIPGGRSEITRAEFQALKAEYGATPAIEPTTAPVSNEAENLADRELLAAISEIVNNGASLNWRYWVQQLPTLTAAEAARLICGLDPDLFQSLESRPNQNDQRQPCAKAAMIQRLAEREGMESANPKDWLTWADKHQIAVHDGFKLEVESAPAQNTATPPILQATETKEQRQDRRLQACETYGLVMPKSHLSRLPDGMGDVANREKVTRQAFSTDVKAALKRRDSAIRDGRTVHRA